MGLLTPLPRAARPANRPRNLASSAASNHRSNCVLVPDSAPSVDQQPPEAQAVRPPSPEVAVAVKVFDTHPTPKATVEITATSNDNAAMDSTTPDANRQERELSNHEGASPVPMGLDGGGCIHAGGAALRGAYDLGARWAFQSRWSDLNPHVVRCLGGATRARARTPP